MPVFLVHGLCDGFWVQIKGCLVAYFNNGSFHGRSLVEIEPRWTSLGQDPFDMSSISFINER